MVFGQPNEMEVPHQISVYKQSQKQVSVAKSLEHLDTSRKHNTKPIDHCGQKQTKFKFQTKKGVKPIGNYQANQQQPPQNAILASHAIPVTESQTMAGLMKMLQHMLVHKTAAKYILTRQA
jgi:hypothetical protein